MDYHFSSSNFLFKGRYHANARERDRTHNVNTAFIILRTMIPTEPMDRKLSKIETIRLATKYINHLANALITDSKLNPCSVLQKRLNQRDIPHSLCTFCISDYKRYVKELTKDEEMSLIMDPHRTQKNEFFLENILT